MKYRRLFFFIFIFSGFTRYASAQDAISDSVHVFLQQYMAQLHIPGMQAVVIRHGKIVFSRCYGFASLQDSVPVSRATVFSINSITKAFTGVAVMQLIEAKKLDLNAPVSRYLDSLPMTWQKVTIRQLLSHTSGLPNIMGDDNERMVAEGTDSAAWSAVQKAPLQSLPGERFSYNQTNYLLLGKIINKLTNENFTQFIKDRQLAAAGLHTTVYGDSHAVIPHHSGEYAYRHKMNNGAYQPGVLGNVFEEQPANLLTAAGLNSSAEDLAQWIIALQAGRFFKDQSSLQTLWTPGLLNNGKPSGFGPLLNGYAMGVETVIREEHPAIAAIGGGRAAFFIYPEDDLAVVVLTNLLGASPEAFIDQLASWYLPDMRIAAAFGLSGSIQQLRSALIKTGFKNAANMVNALKKQYPGFDPDEYELNVWGYALLQQGELLHALEIFKLNTELYPASWNTYDSYGETLLKAGQKEKARKMYARSVELNPANENGKKVLETLSK